MEPYPGGAAAHIERVCTELLKSDTDLQFIAVVDAQGAAQIFTRDGVKTATLDATWAGVRDTVSGLANDPITKVGIYRHSSLIQMLDRGAVSLHVGLSLREYHSGIAQLWQLFLLVGVLCVGFALLASMFYARKLVHPLRALRGVVMQVSEGRLEARAKVGSRDEVGELSRTLNTMIEHLQQTHGELSKAKEEAVAASEAKSRFLATVSHEIRTPINGVIGMLKLLKDSSLDRQQERQVETAIASARALLSVIEGILDFSKIEAGKIELESIDYDLPRAVDSAVAIFVERAREKKLDLKKMIATDVPGRLKGDPNRITQVLINLLGNAFKFTERGTVSVNVRLETEAEARRIRFEVADTGVGISPSQQERLFQPFTQADSSTTRKYGGTGLGLAICKQLIELMGGRINVSSAEGVGTVFWFTLPLVEGAPAPAEAQEAAAPAPVIDPLSPKAAILVVADEFGVVLEFLFDPGGFLLDAFVDIDLFLGVVADRVRQHPVLQAVKGRRGAVEREHARHGVFVTVVGRPVDLVHLQVGETGEQKQAQRGAGDQHDQPLSDGHGVRSKCRQRCSNHTLEGRACQARECPWRITFGVFWKAFFVVHSPPGAAGGEVPLKARFWTF